VATVDLKNLAAAIGRYAATDGVYNTAIPELCLARFSAPTDLAAILYEPSLCIIAQGAKEVLLADETHRLDPARSLLVSVDLPVTARVSEATPGEPYLAARISLDPAVVGELVAENLDVRPGPPPGRALVVTPIDEPLLDAVLRLVTLTGCPEDVGSLAPLVLREITYRVLKGPQGARLRQIAAAGAPAHRIATAIRWLRGNFTAVLKVDVLAKQVGMSVSAFHLHFKNVTTMSPLQYQKRLRLQEARRLMLGDGLDAAEAAFRVGYESPSQFGREYRRMFGASPRRDVSGIKVEPHPQTV
jgi:AraC-like DNA-binding protein